MLTLTTTLLSLKITSGSSSSVAEADTEEGSQHGEDMTRTPAGASSTSRLQVVTSSHCWLTSPRAASLHSTSYTAEERCDCCNHTDDITSTTAPLHCYF